MRIHPSRLRHLYVDERLTAAELAAGCGCSESTIFRELRRCGIPAHPRGPRGSPHRRPWSPGERARWSAGLAWVIGIIASDGNLSPDRRHLSVVSKDVDLLESVRHCLELRNRITRHASEEVYRLQWSDRLFYDWLLAIGLTPAKSLTLGPLQIPDDLFIHFFRGCIDGDGSIVTYVDRYNTYKKSTYVYVRLYLSIVSASQLFLGWLRASVERLFGTRGYLSVKKHPSPNPLWCLKYAKRESLILIRRMYADLSAPCLRRKREIAAEFLVPRTPPLRRGPGRPMVL